MAICCGTQSGSCRVGESPYDRPARHVPVDATIAVPEVADNQSVVHVEIPTIGHQTIPRWEGVIEPTNWMPDLFSIGGLLTESPHVGVIKEDGLRYLVSQLCRGFKRLFDHGSRLFLADHNDPPVI